MNFHPLLSINQLKVLQPKPKQRCWTLCWWCVGCKSAGLPSESPGLSRYHSACSSHKSSLHGEWSSHDVKELSSNRRAGGKQLRCWPGVMLSHTTLTGERQQETCTQTKARQQSCVYSEMWISLAWGATFRSLALS